MSQLDHIESLKANTPAHRDECLTVLREVYAAEKEWVQDDTHLFAESDLGSEAVSWFLVRFDGQPAGVVRVLYELPLDLYKDYGLKLLDGAGGINVEEFLAKNRIAEIGRFAVADAYRRKILVAAALMRIASHETVNRGFTHYVTDVFEGEEHSPLAFHRKVLGFQPVATHDHGEIDVAYRRITMLLDFAEAYRQFKKRNTFIHRFIAEGLSGVPGLQS